MRAHYVQVTREDLVASRNIPQTGITTEHRLKCTPLHLAPDVFPSKLITIICIMQLIILAVICFNLCFRCHVKKYIWTVASFAFPLSIFIKTFFGFATVVFIQYIGKAVNYFFSIIVIYCLHFLYRHSKTRVDEADNTELEKIP